MSAANVSWDLIKMTHFVQRAQCVELHDGKVITEEDEGRDVDDVLRSVPQMGEKLHRAGGNEPDQIRDENFPKDALSKPEFSSQS